MGHSLPSLPYFGAYGQWAGSYLIHMLGGQKEVEDKENLPVVDIISEITKVE